MDWVKLVCFQILAREFLIHAVDTDNVVVDFPEHQLIRREVLKFGRFCSLGEVLEVGDKAISVYSHWK